MGRWAQRRLRASGPPAPAPAALSVLLVQWDAVGEQYTVIFSGAIGYSGAGTFSDFTVDGTTYSTVTGSGVDFVTVDAAGGPGVGASWIISAQPPELSSAVSVPASGLTSS